MPIGRIFMQYFNRTIATTCISLSVRHFNCRHVNGIDMIIHSLCDANLQTSAGISPYRKNDPSTHLQYECSPLSQQLILARI